MAIKKPAFHWKDGVNRGTTFVGAYTPTCRTRAAMRPVPVPR